MSLNFHLIFAKHSCESNYVLFTAELVSLGVCNFHYLKSGKVESCQLVLFRPGMKKYEELPNAILYWIGKDGQSLSSTQRTGFQHMIHVHVMVAQCCMPDKQTFSRRKEKIFNTRAGILENWK